MWMRCWGWGYLKVLKTLKTSTALAFFTHNNTQIPIVILRNRTISTSRNNTDLRGQSEAPNLWIPWSLGDCVQEVLLAGLETLFIYSLFISPQVWSSYYGSSTQMSGALLLNCVKLYLRVDRMKCFISTSQDQESYMPSAVCMHLLLLVSCSLSVRLAGHNLGCLIVRLAIFGIMVHVRCSIPTKPRCMRSNIISESSQKPITISMHAYSIQHVAFYRKASDPRLHIS